MCCSLTKCTQLLWLITTFWWENSLWKLTFTKKYLYLEALLNSVSFSQCIVLNDLHWDWVYHCFVLRRQETYNMKWLFSPLLDVRLHERITLWQKQTGLVTDTMICGYLSTSECFLKPSKVCHMPWLCICVGLWHKTVRKWSRFCWQALRLLFICAPLG